MNSFDWTVIASVTDCARRTTRTLAVWPIRSVSGWNGEPRRDLSIEDKPLRLRGETFARGLGTHAVSEIVYKVRSDFRRFPRV